MTELKISFLGIFRLSLVFLKKVWNISCPVHCSEQLLWEVFFFVAFTWTEILWVMAAILNPGVKNGFHVIVHSPFVFRELCLNKSCVGLNFPQFL